MYHDKAACFWCNPQLSTEDRMQVVYEGVNPYTREDEPVVTKRRFLCKLGIHAWQLYRTKIFTVTAPEGKHHNVTTWHRCKRDGCPKDYERTKVLSTW